VSGEPVRVVYRKWPDRPHWEYDAVRLGQDDLGVWVGAPVGTPVSRPGAGFVSDQAMVGLVPHAAPYVATFYARGGTSHCDVYVDITTVPVWQDGTVTAYDLDLDVVRGWTGRVWVDDEDEFAAHRVRYAYPGDLVRMAATSCDTVRADLEAGRPPYDGSAGAWFAALEATVLEPS
jgi:uncharacterized protein